jgi:Flp pilus assembly CpaE family ATPase
VLNRYSKKGPLSDERIEKALGRPISVRIPNSYNEVIRAINSGTPISGAARSDFGAAIQKWAQLLTTNTGSARASATELAGQPQAGMKAMFGF